MLRLTTVILIERINCSTVILNFNELKVLLVSEQEAADSGVSVFPRISSWNAVCQVPREIY